MVASTYLHVVYTGTAVLGHVNFSG